MQGENYTGRRMTAVMAICFAAAAIIIASENDYREAQAQELEYCERVQAGEWPDFRENYGEVCGDARQD